MNAASALVLAVMLALAVLAMRRTLRKGAPCECGGNAPSCRGCRCCDSGSSCPCGAATTATVPESGRRSTCR